MASGSLMPCLPQKKEAERKRKEVSRGWDQHKGHSPPKLGHEMIPMESPQYCSWDIFLLPSLILIMAHCFKAYLVQELLLDWLDIIWLFRYSWTLNQSNGIDAYVVSISRILVCTFSPLVASIFFIRKSDCPLYGAFHIVIPFLNSMRVFLRVCF